MPLLDTKEIGFLFWATTARPTRTRKKHHFPRQYIAEIQGLNVCRLPKVTCSKSRKKGGIHHQYRKKKNTGYCWRHHARFRVSSTLLKANTSHVALTHFQSSSGIWGIKKPEKELHDDWFTRIICGSTLKTSFGVKLGISEDERKSSSEATIRKLYCAWCARGWLSIH